MATLQLHRSIDEADYPNQFQFGFKTEYESKIAFITRMTYGGSAVVLALLDLSVF